MATAILIDQELWGFYAPSNVSVEDVKAATSRVQPHYAVPTKYLSLETFPETAYVISNYNSVTLAELFTVTGKPINGYWRKWHGNKLRNPHLWHHRP